MRSSRRSSRLCGSKCSPMFTCRVEWLFPHQPARLGFAGIARKIKLARALARISPMTSNSSALVFSLKCLVRRALVHEDHRLARIRTHIDSWSSMAGGPFATAMACCARGLHPRGGRCSDDTVSPN